MKSPRSTINRPFHSAANALGCLALILTGLCLTVGTVRAADPAAVKKEAKKQVKSNPAQSAETDETRVVTGSLIPQKVKSTRIPVTSSPVVIISRLDIEHSGQTSLAAVLRRQALGR